MSNFKDTIQDIHVYVPFEWQSTSIVSSYHDLIISTGKGRRRRYIYSANITFGYSLNVGGVSRSKIEAILAAPSIKAIAPGKRLDFVIVPDICVDGAYDESVKEVKYIVHTASSLGEGVEDQERDVIAPAIKGTRGMLKSAAKASTVKRIVVTSSVLAVVRWEDFFYNESDVYVFLASFTLGISAVIWLSFGDSCSLSQSSSGFSPHTTDIRVAIGSTQRKPASSLFLLLTPILSSHMLTQRCKL